MQVYYPSDLLDCAGSGWVLGWYRQNSVCLSSFVGNNHTSSLDDAVKIFDELGDINTDTDLAHWGTPLCIIARIVLDDDGTDRKRIQQSSTYAYYAIIRVSSQTNPHIIPKNRNSKYILVFKRKRSSNKLEFLGYEPVHVSTKSKFIGAQFSSRELCERIASFKRPKPHQLYTRTINWEEAHNTQLNASIPTDFQYTLNQINSTVTVEIQVRSKKNTARDNPLKYPTWGQSRIALFLCWLFIQTMKFWLLLGTPLRALLALRIPQFGQIKDISMAAKQLDNRLSRLHNIVSQWNEFTVASRDSPQRHSLYWYHVWIRFYDSLYIVILDWLLGLLFIWLWWTYIEPETSFWEFPSDTVTKNSIATTMWGYTTIKRMLEWIRGGNPGGIKLNLSAAAAVGDLCLLYIDRWAVIINLASSYFPLLIRILPLSGLLGGAFFLSCLHDVVFFVNMHVYWLYTAVSRLYYVQVLALRSCWLLFRGKKKNNLRNRIDSHEYSIDQFLLGTILFTILSFLLPTTLAFYILFVAAIFVVVFFRLTLHLTCTLLNDAPGYCILLTLLRPGTLSDGVHFRIIDCSNNITYLHLERNSSHWIWIWAHLKPSLKNTLEEYSLSRVLSSIVMGHPIGRVQNT